MEIASAHHVRARYLGPTAHKPARFSLAWENWPSEGGTKRVVVPWQDPRDLAQTAAGRLCDFLNSGDTGLHVRPVSVSYASAAPDEWSFHVNTEIEPA